MLVFPSFSLIIIFSKSVFWSINLLNCSDFIESLQEPTKNHGYRIHIVLRDGTEVMSIPGCCVQSHTVTTAVDGSADETLEFMTYLTPSYGETPDQVALADSEL